MGGKSAPELDPSQKEALKAKAKLDKLVAAREAKIDQQVEEERAAASKPHSMNNNVHKRKDEPETLVALRQGYREALADGDRRSASVLKKRIDEHEKVENKIENKIKTSSGIREKHKKEYPDRMADEIISLPGAGSLDKTQLRELFKKDPDAFQKLGTIIEDGGMSTLRTIRNQNEIYDPESITRLFNNYYQGQPPKALTSYESLPPSPKTSPTPAQKKKETYNKIHQHIGDVEAVRQGELVKAGMDPAVVRNIRARHPDVFEKLSAIAQVGFPYAQTNEMQAVLRDPLGHREMLNDVYNLVGQPRMHDFESPVSMSNTPESTPPTSPLASPRSSRPVSPQGIRNFKSMQETPFDVTAGIRKESPKDKLLSSYNALKNNLPGIKQQQTEALNNPRTYDSNINEKFDPNLNRDFFKYIPKPQATPSAAAPPQQEESPYIVDIGKGKVPPAGHAEIASGFPSAQRSGQRAVIQTAANEYSKPHEPYPYQQLADISPATTEAYARANEYSPFTHKPTLEENAAIEEEIKGLKQHPQAYERAKNYLEGMTQNPGAHHKELMGPEEDAYLKSFGEQMDKDFYENIVPNAIHKYRVPGMKGRGHDTHVLKDISEKYAIDKAHKLNEIRFGNKMKGYDISQKHAGQLGQAATTAGALTQADIARGQSLTDMSHNFNKEKRAERTGHLGTLERQGEALKGHNQQKLDLTKAAFDEARGHGKKNLEWFSNMVNHNLAPTDSNRTFYKDMRPNPGWQTANQAQKFGNAAASLGAYFMPRNQNMGQVPQYEQQAKKGGLIKPLKKYADGGSVMGQAVQDAVIDKESPLHELRRLMNRQRLEQYQKKSVQRRFRQGGAVGPIQKGAQEAQEFMADKELRGHYQSQKHTPEGFSGSGAIKAFMKGYGSLDDTASSKAARGFVSQMDEIDLERKNNEAQKTSAFEKLYNLDKEKKKELADLRKEERDLKKLGLEERYTNAQINKLGRETDVKKPKLDRSEQEILSAANKTIQMAPDIEDDLNRLEEISDLIDTGGYFATHGVDSPWAQSMLGGGKQALYDEFDKLSNSLASKAAAMQPGSRGGQALVKLFREEKPNKAMTREAIKKVISKMRDQTQRSVAQAYHINEAVESGASPRMAITEFQKEQKIEKEKKIALEKIKKDEEEFKKNSMGVNEQPHTGEKESLAPYIGGEDLAVQPSMPQQTRPKLVLNTPEELAAAKAEVARRKAQGVR